MRRLPLPPVAATLSLLAMLFALGCSPGRPQAQASTTPPPPPIEFVGQWGVHGTSPGELDDPAGPAIDAVGRVYLADRGTVFLQKFETDGVPLLSFEDSFIKNAGAVAVDAGGGIYVANVRSGAIQVFFPEGEPLRVLRVTPQRDYDGPFAFSVDASGKIFVPDPTGDRVQVLTSQGRLERAWKVAGSGGPVARPFAAIAAPDGSVYIADGQSNRIVQSTNQGLQTNAWEYSGPGGAITSIAVSAKNVFAMHAASPRLTVWSLDGHKVLDDDLGGRLSASPACCTLAIGMQGDLMVLDSGVPRVLHFRVHLGSS